MNSRDKGARGERELANLLKEYGFDSHRGAQYKGSPDSPDVTGIEGVHIECKRVERLDLYKALRQSSSDAAEDELPVVIHRKNREGWLVTMTLDSFIKLLKGEEK